MPIITLHEINNEYPEGNLVSVDLPSFNSLSFQSVVGKEWNIINFMDGSFLIVKESVGEIIDLLHEVS